MADSLRVQTLALMGQHFLAQALASGGSLNSAVADMLLQAPAANGREKSAAALTGRIRGDAGTLRQGAKNAAEASSMASLIKDAALSIGETLSEMQTLAQSVASGQALAADAQGAFTSLASKLSATISGAQYNGISLLDKTGWAGDERLTVSGGSATLSIQVGQSASTFTLRDLSDLHALKKINLGAADLQKLTEKISTAVGAANTLASGYESLAGAYASEAKYLENQAEILTQAAARSAAGAASPALPSETDNPEAAMKNILMDILLRDQGKLVDTSS